MRRSRGDYPENWREIAAGVKEAAGWQCVRCGARNRTGTVLTVHHIDMDKTNCAWWNLAALCQVCHLVVQGKVDVKQGWMFEYSDWFKPYLAGYLAHRYGMFEELEFVKDHMGLILEFARIAVDFNSEGFGDKKAWKRVLK